MIAGLVIIPYVGVGPLKLGMRRDQVHAVLGAPARTKKSKFGPRVMDYWSSEDITAACSSQDGVVEEVSFGAAQSEAEIQGRKIFGGPGADVYRDLCRMDGHPRADVGFTVLFQLGIVLDGFLITDQEQRVVTVFAAGKWREDDERLKAIPLP